MEQYWMPKARDFENLRLCLDHYDPLWIYIRAIGSRGGDVKMNERLDGLDFTKDDSGLYLFFEKQHEFHFPLRTYFKGFALAYERIAPDGGRMMIPAGDPYDPTLPEPQQSILRNVLDYHLLEIGFSGRVHIKRHSPWKGGLDYWTIDVRD